MRMTNFEETKNKLEDKTLLFEKKLKKACNDVLVKNNEISNIEFINFYSINNACSINEFISGAFDDIRSSKYKLTLRDENVNEICKIACIKS